LIPLLLAVPLPSPTGSRH